MNAKETNARLVVTVVLALLGSTEWLVGCSSKNPLGSVNGDAGDAASSGSGGAGGSGGVGDIGTGGAGGQSCPGLPGAEGAPCTAAQEGCVRCVFQNVACCRDLRQCRQGVWSRLEAGPCPSDGGSGETGSNTQVATNPCPPTSPGGSGATCAIDQAVFCFYGTEPGQEQCRCRAGQWLCNTVACQRITQACAAALPPASALMCTEAAACDYCCGGGTEIARCTCQPGQSPSCRYAGPCGG